MAKVLKPYTIIPPDLYVKRDADRQIRNIIKDMGRPGYVLVSRQMGKTNLLLNAKRELQDEQDIFLYIDLSAHFDSAKLCFENIVDLALEMNPEKFGSINNEILEKRKLYVNTPAHKQHLNELRALLKSYTGKLVIILDEIDALTKTNYSDQIFSQIRSIYFTRVNFPELNRVTYILSGVIEPSEIIKDPKISPFNIGQKIFLNDFSRKEFESFLKLSKISLPDSLSDRIFFWTNGNPRITWDVLSDVENAILEENQISIEKIDKIVKDMYLTAFDKPPIDNIRELVKNDREIRNAIIEIEYNKGNEISQRIKNKLYLAGIVNYESENVRIKNEIIRQSINLEWIKSVEEDERGLVKIAFELFEKEKYVECLNTFERYLETNSFNEIDKAGAYFYMGYASYKIRDFKQSIEYLELANFDVDEEPKMYFRVLNQKGLSHYYADNISESLKCFKTVITSGKKDENYSRALVNFGSIALKSEEASFKAEAIKIFNEIIDEKAFVDIKLTPLFVQELKSIAHYNIALIHARAQNNTDAKKHFLNARDLAATDVVPTILIQLILISENDSDKYSLMQEIVHLILESKVNPLPDDPEKPINFNLNHLRDIFIATYLEYHDTLFLQLKHKFDLLGEKPISVHLYDLAVFLLNEHGDWDLAENVLRKLYSNRENHEYSFDKSTLYKTLKLLASVVDSRKEPAYTIAYLSLFEKDRKEIVDYIDIQIFATIIYHLKQAKKHREALRYIHLIDSVRATIQDDLLVNYLIIYNLESQIYLDIGDTQKANQVARKILDLSENDKVKHQKSNLLGETGFDIILNNAKMIVSPHPIKLASVKAPKRYGRNEIVKVRYKDGSIIESKYKKLQIDLNAGECFVLE